MRTLTAAVCSYQRRESLLRLLASLGEQARGEPAAFTGVDVLVVLDGSEDGSREAAEALAAEYPVPLRVVWQPNRGLAHARNVCLSDSRTELLWFLDDDFVPAPGTLGRHRAAHESGREHLVLGPCLVPEGHPVPGEVARWWDERYARLGAAGRVERFDQFSIANASGPRSIFQAVGGFDESFVGYGLEDYEIGVRIMARGVEEVFDPEAKVWHYTGTDEKLSVQRNADMGSNAVRMARAHPELRDQLIPPDTDRPYWQFLARSPIRSRWALSALARVASLASRTVLRPFEGLHERSFGLASIAAYASGLASEDPAAVRLLLDARPAVGARGATVEEPR